MTVRRRTGLRPATLLLLLVLPLLLGATKPPASKGARATVQRENAARKTLEAVTARYKSLKGYHLEGRGEQSMTSGQGESENVSWVRFLVARPDRYASEVRGVEMTTRLVMDGDSVWTAIPEMGQYQAQPVAVVRPAMDSLSWARQFDPAGQYGQLLEDVATVQPLGRDTVHTNAGPVTCERFAITTKSGAAAGEGVRVHPRVLWVDPATHMVLLDSVQIEQQHPQIGALTTVNVTRMVVAKPDPAFAADAFHFRAGGDLKRVRRFMRRSPQHSDLEGRKASDFTLERLDHTQPVKLSDLEGNVVLLDFWATWCGPCRSWMPIVAKAHRDYADKGLRVFAVNERETEAKVKTYLTRQKIDVPVLMDRSGEVGTMYKANSIPLTVVIGRDGNVVRVMVGLHGEDDLKDALEEAGLRL